MKPLSCGMLLYKYDDEVIKFLLVKPGGEWNKHSPWSIPKGIKEQHETDELQVALRETEEELGLPIVINNTLYDLGYESNDFKIYHIYGLEHDIDVTKVKSNMCDFTWKGKQYTVPEISEAKWVNMIEAEKICSKHQLPFLKKMLLKLCFGK